MTTTTDGPGTDGPGTDGPGTDGPGTPAPPPGPPWPTRPALRRSRSDRMVTGVAGGLGEYFGVDPVIFRVLFAVLSFFGGVGLLLYLACWLLIPERDIQVSALDRGIAQLRQRHVPPWLVIGAGALVLWLGWFSWWAPGPTFPALALIAVLLIVLVRRISTPPMPPGWVRDPRPHAPYPWQSAQGQNAAQWQAAQAAQPQPVWPDGQPLMGDGGSETEPLVPPLNDFRRSMSDWYNEAREAKKQRQARRRPIKIAVGLVLLAGLAVIGIADALNRVQFGVYIWFLAGALTIGFLISLAARRTVWGLGLLVLPLIPALIVIGGTKASITDGSGETGRAPTAVTQLHDEQRFAGDTTLDLTKIDPASLRSSPERTISITQAAGRVRLRIPQSMNVVIDGSVHIGDIQVGTSHAVGDYVGGLNTALTVSPPTTATGSALHVKVNLTVGHIQIDRV
jgi:phage shock protein PspC (stress-responsive transcriptional regulator)